MQLNKSDAASFTANSKPEGYQPIGQFRDIPINQLFWLQNLSVAAGDIRPIGGVAAESVFEDPISEVIRRCCLPEYLQRTR